MTKIHTVTKKGFTIVELLIVIVVLGILASISIVSYGSLQGRARQAMLTSDISNIKKAMEFYRIEKGSYPSCPSGGNCWFDDIRPQLKAENLGSIDADNFGYAYYSSMPTIWAMEYAAGDPPYKLPRTCKFGVNVPSDWFSSAPTC